MAIYSAKKTSISRTNCAWFSARAYPSKLDSCAGTVTLVLVVSIEAIHHVAMSSPFPASASIPGKGTAHLTLLPGGNPSFTTLTYTYPLKLLPSKPHTLRSEFFPAKTTQPSRQPHANISTSSEASSADTVNASKEPSGTVTSAATTERDAESTSRNKQPSAAAPQDPAAATTSSNGATLLTTATNLATPEPHAVPLLFLLTYGGGLLSTDHIALTLTLSPSTRLTLVTQGSTKIYRPSDPSLAPPLKTSSQNLHCTLLPHSALWYAPHPTQPFAGSYYTQKQVLEMHEGSSLGVLDWVSEGRRARRESWEMETWRGRNEV